MATDTRIIPCPACMGDKGHDVPYDIDRRDGSLIEHWQPCITCEATGDVEVWLEPVDLEDLCMIVPTVSRETTSARVTCGELPPSHSTAP